MAFIMLDPRAGSGVLAPHIPKHRIVRTQLEAGDLAWTGNGPDRKVLVGVEVKHISDFLQSMNDGRLPQGQLRRMYGFGYDYVFLLLQDRIRCDRYGYLQVWRPKSLTKAEEQRGETRYDSRHYEHGYWADAIYGRKSRMLFMYFWERIVGLSVRGGVRLLSAGSNEEVGWLICGQVDWWQKSWSDHKSLEVFDESHIATMLDPSGVAKTIHAMVYGIGWQKAFAAADYFGTIRAAVNASETEWRQIEGIDKVLARRAARAVDTMHVRRTVSGGVEVAKRRKVGQPA